MPSKRTPTGRRSKARITPEAVALFKRALALYDQQDAWEEDGGRRREYLEVTCDLQDVLGPHPVARKRARHPRAGAAAGLHGRRCQKARRLQASGRDPA